MALHGYSQHEVFKGFEHLFTPPKTYTVFSVANPVKIDGVLDEKEWENAPWTTNFVDIEGLNKPVPYLQTRCKMLWDSNYLYIAAELDEPHIWGNLLQRDAIIYNDNDFEVFIDPDNDTRHYFEIEFNALNTVFDLYMSKPYRNRGILRMDWNADHLLSAVQLTGTLNNPADTDKKWVLEIAVPFRDLRLDTYTTAPPANKTLWRINFSRVQWETEVKEGLYVKKKNAQTGRNLPENNWVWSPQGVVNMHFPERWGYIQFSTQQPQLTANYFTPPDAADVKKLLWLIYYKQKQYHRENHRYSASFSAIHLPETVTLQQRIYKLTLAKADYSSFEASIFVGKAGSGWVIDQDGYIEPIPRK